MRTILSDELINFGKEYVLGNIKKIDDPLFENIFLSYLNDLNSSSLREAITCKIIGCKWNPNKLGDDGFDSETNSIKEIKPKYIYDEKKSNGSGNFGDLTHSRLDAYISKNITIVTSLFVKNHLIYIIEFPIKIIEKKLRDQLIQKCDIEGNRYCRSAMFNYKDYIEHEETKILFVNKHLLNLLNCVPKNFLLCIDKKLNLNSIPLYYEPI